MIYLTAHEETFLKENVSSFLFFVEIKKQLSSFLPTEFWCERRA
jgi:hypothetical protein